MQHSGQKLNISIWVGVGICALVLAVAGGSGRAVPTSIAPSRARAVSITWITNLKQAIDLSKKTGKPMLLDFSATWCGPCQAMIHDTFPDASVQSLLEKTICVRIDVDQDAHDAQVYNVDAIPRILLFGVGDTSRPKMDVTGYEDADAFGNDLRQALGMPQLPGSTGLRSPAARTSAESVAGALESNSYGKLKAQDKAIAVQGLRDLVDEMGEPAADQMIPLAPNVFARAGADATAALIAGMSSPYLTERVGAYAMYRRIHAASANTFVFDPWTNRAVRANQLARLASSARKSP